jgi:hypothetical protein
VFRHCLILTCLVRVLIQLLPEEPAHDQDCIQDVVQGEQKDALRSTLQFLLPLTDAVLQ